MELLEYMEIVDRAHYLPALLSGGEQQRVDIDRALANNPNSSWRMSPLLHWTA